MPEFDFAIAERISIHAPRTGSDVPCWIHPQQQYDFNPRSPHGERRSEDDVLHPASVFQSTLPARGATAVNLMTRKRYIISIHAPRTGRDGRQLCGRVRRGYFNPRSPHGERRCPALRPIRRRHFNPRSPHGERRGIPYITNCRAFSISIHAPRTGSDSQARREEARREISIHAPRTGSDRGGFLRRCLVTISIHAPRTGSDAGWTMTTTSTRNFNPRSPHGERRGCAPAQGRQRAISIHAPRTGSDAWMCWKAAH